MASYGMNDVKNGMKILINNEPAIITETDRGSATARSSPGGCRKSP